MLCRKTTAGPVHVDGGRAALELAAALGEDLSSQDVEFLAKYPEKIFALDESYRGAIADAERDALIADDDDEPLAQVMSILWGSAALLWSEPDDALERMGIENALRVSSKTNLAAAVMFPHISRALSAPRTVLYTASTAKDDSEDAHIVCVSTPLILIGRRLQVERDRASADDDAPGDLELRFLLGRAAELARPERVPAVGLPYEDFANLVASLRRTFGNEAMPDDDAADAAREHDELLRKTLPVKVRTQLETVIKERLAKRPEPRPLHPRMPARRGPRRTARVRRHRNGHSHGRRPGKGPPTS